MCGCLSAFYAAFSRHGTNVFNNRFSGTLLHPLGSFSAPQEPQAVPYKQLIILPITLVFGSSHSVLPQHLQLGAPRFAGRRGGFGESSFSFERCNQTFNSQLTAAFFLLFFFLHPHTHLTCMNLEERSVSVRQRRGKSVFTFLLSASSFHSWRRLRKEDVAKVLPHEKLFPSLFLL